MNETWNHFNQNCWNTNVVTEAASLSWLKSKAEQSRRTMHAPACFEESLSAALSGGGGQSQLHRGKNWEVCKLQKESAAAAKLCWPKRLCRSLLSLHACCRPCKKLQKSWILGKLNIHFLRNKNKGYKSHFGAKVQLFWSFWRFWRLNQLQNDLQFSYFWRENWYSG